MTQAEQQQTAQQRPGQTRHGADHAREQPDRGQRQSLIGQHGSDHARGQRIASLERCDRNQPPAHAWPRQEIAKQPHVAPPAMPGGPLRPDLRHRGRFAHEPDGQQDRNDEQGKRGVGQSPAEVRDQPQQHTAPDDHPRLVADDLHAVAQTAQVRRQPAHGKSVRRDVLGRGNEVQREQNRQQQGEGLRHPVAEIPRGHKQHQPAGREVERQQPAPPRPEPVQKRRPQKLQRPGEGKQRREADGRQRHAVPAQQRRQRPAQQPRRQALREVQQREHPQQGHMRSPAFPARRSAARHRCILSAPHLPDRRRHGRQGDSARGPARFCNPLRPFCTGLSAHRVPGKRPRGARGPSGPRMGIDFLVGKENDAI